MWDMKSKSRTDMYIKESIVAVKVRVQTNEEHIQASNNECRPHESKDGMLTCSPVDRDVARQCSCAIFIHRRYKMPFFPGFSKSANSLSRTEQRVRQSHFRRIGDHKGQYISNKRPSRFVIVRCAQDDTPASASFDSHIVLFEMYCCLGPLRLQTIL